MAYVTIEERQRRTAALLSVVFVLRARELDKLQRAQFEALGRTADPAAGPVLPGIAAAPEVYPVKKDGPAIDVLEGDDTLGELERENAALRLHVRELEREVERPRANPTVFAPVEPLERLTVPATER